MVKVLKKAKFKVFMECFETAKQKVSHETNRNGDITPRIFGY
ncbi:hypothetical protein [Liquorilactobacillus uvarum]|nr:hypothetical protein [Liquorilactobacillus uvarum]